MKNEEIVFAGFGGQGILSMGKFLAYAGMNEGLNVSWLPSYGPEMRGGTANCSVILSSSPIGSPIVTEATTLVIMNRPSLDKFENTVIKGGLIVIDSELVTREIVRQDVSIVKIPAESESEKIGSKKIANMILLGALVEKTKIVNMESVLEALKEHGKMEFYEKNEAALLKGAEFAKVY